MSEQLNRDDDRDEDSSLETQLRAMPRAAVPEHLLARLLADVPQVASLAPRRSLTRWLVPMSAIAALLCLAAAIAIFERRPAARSEFDVSANYVVYRPVHQQETDPCSILPPLPVSSRL